MSFDDLYNNFKIIEQEVKETTSLSSQNMAFVSSPRSTNEVNTAYGVSTANTQVSPASTQASTASTQVSTANLSDATVYAFLASQPNGSQLIHEDLVQIYKDDLEEMDLKWECRQPRNQDSRNMNQDNSKRTVNVEETASYAMVAIDGAGLFSPPKLDLSNSGLEEFQLHEFEGYGPKTSNSVNEYISNETKESPDSPLVKKERVVSWNNYTRVNYNYSTKKAHPSAHKNMALKAVLMKTGQRPLNTVRPVNIAHPKTTGYSARPMSRFSKSAQLTGNPQLELQEKGVIDSVCSRHITGNMFYLSEYEEIHGGYVAFGGDPKGGKITSKDTECVVLSPDFKLLDESQVLLRVPRKNNMYSVDLNNVTSLGGLTCLFAKATLDESNLWHRRLGHINFKTMNKLIEFDLRLLKLLIAFVLGERVIVQLAYDVHMSRMIPQLVIILEGEMCTFGNQSNGSAGKSRVETVPDKDYILLPLWTQDLLFVFGSKDSPGAGCKPSGEEEKKDAEGLGNTGSEVPNTEKPRINQEKDANVNNTNNINAVSPIINAADIKDNAVDKNIVYGCADDPNMPNLKEIVAQSLTDPSWIEAMQDELPHFKLQQVWTLVDLPNGKKAIGTKWIYKNKKDERGIVIRNKARLVAQGYPQEDRIDYDDAFALLVRIKAIRFFLAYASFKEFIVYQMDMKSAFLYGRIEEEVYVCQPLRIDGIFISQDKYVDEILKKFGFSTVKTSSTPMETSKPLLKDENDEDVDVHLYRSMIGSLMYLTSSRPDIMFAVCACARFQVTPKVSHLLVVKRIFRYLKGQPKLGLWYPKDLPFNLEAYTNNDYAGTSVPTEVITDEAVYKEMYDSVERATTTATGLDAEQDKGIINHGDAAAQTRVLALETTKTNQASEIKNLKKRIKYLEKKASKRTYKLTRSYKIGSSRRIKSSDEASLGDQEDASKQGMIIDNLDADEGVTLVDEAQGRNDQVMFDTGVLDDEEVVVVKEVSTADPVTTTGEVVTTVGVKLMNQWKKHFTRLRAKEKRRKPPTKAQKRNQMCTYLKNMAGFTHNQLKNKSFEKVQKSFDNTISWINSFVPMDKEGEEGSSKRAGEEVESDTSKKQKLDEKVEAEADNDQE
uniref:Uncharacterized protein n=1 Tax=Tanacetum cinerariifolium TaxID=118510 RepID=A0A699GQY6_TANCI|nr:hypothetical protein [Tanacetum cinerariifolium]